MKKHTMVTFLFPDPSSGNFNYHLGVNYIIAYLRSKGVYSEQFTNTRYLSLRELTNLILKNQPKIVGFTCFDSNCYMVKLIAEQIKIRRPDILIIAGGHSATFSDKNLLEAVPEIDICVRGEGEYTTLELVKYINDRKRLEAIKGITYRKNGTVIHNEDRPLIKDETNSQAALDIIPSPYLARILSPKDLSDQGQVIPILTSRGCVNRCAYCNFAAMSRQTIRYHSVERIIRELKAIESLNKNGKVFTVYILDDTFTFNKKRTVELCERIIKEKIKLEFWCGTRADCVDKKLLELLHKAGVTWINFGLESAVPKILYAMKKVRMDYGKKNGFIPEKKFIKNIKDSVKQAKDIGFKVTVSILLGFPGESFKDGLKTLKFVSKLKVNSYLHNQLDVFPGTELFKFLTLRKLGGENKCFRLFHDHSYSEYNLPILPRLHNAFSNQVAANLYFFWGEALTGLSVKPGSRYPEYVMMSKSNFPVEWAVKNLAIQTKIVFGADSHRLVSNKMNIEEMSVKSLLEILAIVSKKETQVPSGLQTNNTVTTLEHSFLKSFLFKKLTNIPPDATAMGFDVFGGQDIGEIKKKIKSINSKGDLNAKANILSNRIMIDACRWSSVCPALKVKRLIIDDNGDIKPCFAGGVVGNTKSPLSKARKEMSRISREIKAKRGCNSCAAKNRCSKCSFLGSLKADDYCTIMKKHTEIVEFTEEIKAFNRVNYVVYLSSPYRMGGFFT